MVVGHLGGLPKIFWNCRSSDIDFNAFWSNRRDTNLQLFNCCSLHRLAKKLLADCEALPVCVNVTLVSCAGKTVKHAAIGLLVSKSKNRTGLLI